MTEYCAVIGTHSMVWGDTLLYGHVPDPFPQCGIGSGHARLMLTMHRRHGGYHMRLMLTMHRRHGGYHMRLMLTMHRRHGGYHVRLMLTMHRRHGGYHEVTYVARLIPRVTFLSQRYGSNPSELSSMLTRLTWLESMDWIEIPARVVHMGYKVHSKHNWRVGGWGSGGGYDGCGYVGCG